MKRKAILSCGLVAILLVGLVATLGGLPTGVLAASPPAASGLSIPLESAADGETLPNVELLYFTQQQCPPCRQMLPMVQHLIGQGFPIRKVDSVEQPDLVRQFQVQSTPTLILLRDGRELKRHSGVATAHQISSLLIDAGYPADLNVLSKQTPITPIVNFFQRLRPVDRGESAAAPLAEAPRATAGRRAAVTEPSRTARAIADPAAAIPPAQWTDGEAQAMAATARIKVQYRDRGQTVTDYGSATIIHRHGRDILLLTCGHVFRDSQGRGEIKVELDFSSGQPRQVVPGQLLMYDAGAADVALLAASTDLPIQPAPLATADYRPAPGMVAFSVGCDQGRPPTLRRGQYLSTSMCGAVQLPGQPSSDEMARKFGISGRPVVGRSGGGLFNDQGQLIGVCNAAVVDADEGRYSAIDNVVEILEKSNLARLFLPRDGDSLVAPASSNSGRDRVGPPFPDPAKIPQEIAQGQIAQRDGPRRLRFLPVVEPGHAGTEAGESESRTGAQPILATHPASRPTQLLGQSPR